VTGLTLDTGALIALERGEDRIVALLDRVLAAPDMSIHVPAAVLAQAFRSHRQVRLARLLKYPKTTVVSLDAAMAQVVGLLLGVRRCEDVVDASVVVCARRHRQPVLTGDPRDLRRLDPKLVLEAV
jgi:predicted nucleic acid-binding protein